MSAGGVVSAARTRAVRGSARQRGLSLPPALAPTVFLVFTMLLAWHVFHGQPYTPASDFGYMLGLVGGSMMLVLLCYPLRKHVGALRVAGPLKYWFRMHMLFGVFGPWLVVFHSAFNIRSINAAVALACMLLVAASGVVGRFFYGRIHNGLYGSRASLEDMQTELDARLLALEPVFDGLPEGRQRVREFASLAARPPEGRRARLMHFLTLGWRRSRGVRGLRVALREVRSAEGAPLERAEIDALVAMVEACFRAAQRCAQFSTYARLFSLWHVIHVPFVYLFVVTAVFHVLAVHMY